MNWRCALRAVVVLALILVPFSLRAVDSRGAEPGGTPPRRNSIGFATALYHNRFIDDVISPVIYTSTSPLYELSYRYMSAVHRHTISFGFACYNSGLWGLGAVDKFELIDAKGDVYTYYRSLHKLDRAHYSLEYVYLRRIFTFEQGKSAFHLGGSAGYYSEKSSNIDYWSRFRWRRVKSWLRTTSFAVDGKLERRFRKYDHLGFDFKLTVISYVSHAPYYCPLGSADVVQSEDIEYSWMFPKDFLRWSVRLTYELWLRESVSLEAYYRFQHHRLTEPRARRHVSHILSLGVKIAFTAPK